MNRQASTSWGRYALDTGQPSRSRGLRLTATKPDAIHKEPEYPGATFYGILALGSSNRLRFPPAMAVSLAKEAGGEAGDRRRCLGRRPGS